MINRAPPSDMHKPFEVNMNPDIAHAIPGASAGRFRPFAFSGRLVVVCRNVTHIIRDHLEAFDERFRVLRPGGVLRQLPYVNISFERDVTEKLQSEKEKPAYAATPLFLLRAEKPAE